MDRLCNLPLDSSWLAPPAKYFKSLLNRRPCWLLCPSPLHMKVWPPTQGATVLQRSQTRMVVVTALLLLSCGKPQTSSASDECSGNQSASDKALQVLRQEIAKEVREAIEEEVRGKVWEEIRAETAQRGSHTDTARGGSDSKRAAHSESTRDLAHLIVAKDPEVRAMCMTLLEEKHSVWSQLDQDTFVFHNYLVVSLRC